MPASLHTRLDKQYEALAAEILRRFSPAAQVTPNLKIRGKSGRLRQIDVAVRTAIAGQPVFLAFECKHYSRPVAMKQVEELIGKIEDVKAQIGVLVSDSGFDDGAVARAKEHGRIQLSLLVDSSQGWLKTRLSIQLVVSFTNLVWPYQISLHRITAQDGAEDKIRPINTMLPEDRSFLDEHVRRSGHRAIEEFHRWTNEHVGRLADGQHEWVTRSIGEAVDGLQWTFGFTRITETFSKDDLFVGASGLYDPLQSHVTLGEAGSFTLEESNIRATWTARPAGYAQAGTDHYRRLGSYPTSAVNEVVDGLLASIRSGA